MIFRHRGWTGIALFTDQRHTIPFEFIWSGTRWYCLLLLHPAPWHGRWMGGRCPWIVSLKRMNCIETCREAVRKLWSAAKINHESNSWWITWQWQLASNAKSLNSIDGWYSKCYVKYVKSLRLPSFLHVIYILIISPYGLQQHLENLEEWICYHLVRSYFEVAPKNATERFSWIPGPIDMELLVNQK